MKLKWHVPFVCLMLFIVGCATEEPVEEEKPQAPPEPTCEQIFSELRSMLTPLYTSSTQDVRLEHPVREGLVSQFAGAIPAQKAKLNGQCALDKMEAEMETMIRESQKFEKVRVTKGAIQIYKTLNPGDSKYDSLEKRMDLLIARPAVKFRGVFEVDGVQHAFVEVTDFNRGTRDTFKIREGEEFYAPTAEGNILRLERIVGNQEKLEIWYKPLNDTWEVLGPKLMNTSGAQPN